MSFPVDLHLSNVQVSLDPDNQQLHSFKGCDHCSVVRSFVLSTIHFRRFKWSSPPSLHLVWQTVSCNINLLLTEREGRTGEYGPEVVTVRTECSEVRTKTTEGQYSPVRLDQGRLVSSLLYDIISLAERILSVVSFKSTSGEMSAM